MSNRYLSVFRGVFVASIAAAIVEEKGLVQVSDAAALESIVEKVLDAHPKEAAAYRGGKAKLMLALAKGKQSHDKRESIRRRDQKRELDRERKNNR